MPSARCLLSDLSFTVGLTPSAVRIWPVIRPVQMLECESVIVTIDREKHLFVVEGYLMPLGAVSFP